MKNVLISLVITTYNRAELLRSALESVANSKIENQDAVEVIVVDNNSVDHTRQTVEDIGACGFPFALRYVFEARQGLSYARNRGADEANGIYIAYMDDDQLLEEHYLSRIESVFRYTQAACAGGPVFYYNKEELPNWLAPLLEGTEQRCYAGETKILGSADGKLMGGNMAFVRQELIDIGKFNVDLGRTGDTLLAGEEDELQERLRAAGKIIAHCPDLIQYHSLGPARRTKRYWRQHHFDAGRTLYRRYLAKIDAEEHHVMLGAPRWLWWGLLTKHIPRAVWSLLTSDTAHSFRKQLDVYVCFGQIYEARHGGTASSNGRLPTS